MRNYAFSIALDVITAKTAVAKVKQWLLGEEQHYIVTPNPEMAVMAMQQPQFQQVLESADLSIVDGSGLYIAAKLAGVPLPEKIAGADFVVSLLEQLPLETRFFFLGAEGGVGEKAAERARHLWSSHIVGTYEPPRGIYAVERDALVVRNNVAHEAVLTAIRSAEPTVLFVALGHGIQERWLASFQSLVPSVRVAMGVGGSLDYLAGTVARAPIIFRRWHVEWFWRLVQQPNRWRRICTAVVFFPLVALLWAAKSLFRYRSNVVACILNAQHDILIVSRAGENNHWQLPQGGRESGETVVEAAKREVAEEVGILHIDVVGESPENIYRYSWKRRYKANNQGADFSRRSAYRGQVQTIVYLQFTGSETEITLDNVEHDAWQWVSQRDVVRRVQAVRRPIVELALEYLPKTLKQETYE